MLPGSSHAAPRPSRGVTISPATQSATTDRYTVQFKRRGQWSTVSLHVTEDEATYEAVRVKAERETEGRFVPEMRVVRETPEPDAGVLLRQVIWGDGVGARWSESYGDGKQRNAVPDWLDPKKLGQLYLKILDWLISLVIRVGIIVVVFLTLGYGIPWLLDWLSAEQTSVEATSGATDTADEASDDAESAATGAEDGGP